MTIHLDNLYICAVCLEEWADTPENRFNLILRDHDQVSLLERERPGESSQCANPVR